MGLNNSFVSDYFFDLRCNTHYFIQRSYALNCIFKRGLTQCFKIGAIICCERKPIYI